MGALVAEVAPVMPVNGDAVIQQARRTRDCVSHEIRFHSLLPHLLAGRTNREIRERIPGIGPGALKRARRVFRAKFTQAATYQNMPNIIAMGDENISYHFTEVARRYTGLSTYAMAENVLSTPDPEIFKMATNTGIDLIFTRDLRLNGHDDLSWHADKALREAIKFYPGLHHAFPHIPLIVQIDDDVRAVNDFSACMERDIMTLYRIRFGLLAPICRMSRDRLRFIKAYTDYELPRALIPSQNKPLTVDRHMKAWLRMAYRQAKLPVLQNEHKREIKTLAWSITNTPAESWRVDLSEEALRQLAMPGPRWPWQERRPAHSGL